MSTEGIEKIKAYLQNKYSFIELLGRGGFAEVYLAKDLLLERLVAIKILLPQFSNDQPTRERFIREARIYARLEHHNLIPVYETGSFEDLAFIVMKYIKGIALNNLIASRGPLEPALIKKMICEIADILDYVHAHGIIHRDIKPSNIIIEDESNNFFLADFGIARSDHARTLTQSGLIVGTPHYISPEQIQGRQIDQRADIYAFGATLYEAATGKPMFSGESCLDILYQHVNVRPEPVNKIKKDFPADLNSIILKCLEKNPKNRFQNAREIITATNKGITPAIAALFLSSRKKIFSIASAILLIIAVFSSYLFLAKRKPEPVQPETEKKQRFSADRQNEAKKIEAEEKKSDQQNNRLLAEKKTNRS